MRVNKGPRCERCGKRALGGVVLFDANGKTFGVCCAKGLDLSLLEGMVGDAEPEEEPEPIVIAHDPLDHNHGVHKDWYVRRGPEMLRPVPAAAGRFASVPPPVASNGQVLAPKEPKDGSPG